ncbi:MAG: TRAP transporter small permease [Rubrobacter sp.]|nr:TRAP transporter small permease [Rubrobacter sp.]
MKKTARKALNIIDSVFEYLGLALLVAMVLIVTWQVLARQGLGSAPQWSEELSLILMVWVGFIGIAIGFRERVHIALEFLVSRFPGKAQKVMEKLTCLLVLGFGVFLVVQGWSFTVQTLSSTLPSTGLPRGTLYAVMPLTGAMICLYSALQLFGVATERHPEEIEQEPSPESADAEVPPTQPIAK